MAGTLFHYTTNEGAIGLIASGCLFATNYKYLNDQSELAIAGEILVPIFAREFEAEALNLIKAGKLKPAFLNNYGRSIFELEAKKLLRIILQTTDSHSPIFIASFCRHAADSNEWQDGLLSQWRGYGSIGGCAIEFDEEKIRTLMRSEATDFTYSHISLMEVIYNNHEKSLDMNKVEGLAASMLRLLADRSKENEEAYKKRIDSMYGYIAMTAPTFKKNGFSEEREVRIVAPLMRRNAARQYPEKNNGAFTRDLDMDHQYHL